MRLWFLGSGHFAAVCFAEMVSTFSFEGVVTAPPRKAGRGLKPRPTPLEGAARRAGYEPWRTARIGEEQGLLAAMEASRPDAVLVVDFGRRIPGRLLELPRYGCLNVHPSLLPRYRGAAPVQRAIMDGAAETGVTVFRLVEAMDAGPVLGRERVAIGSEETAGGMLEDLARKGGKILTDVLQLLQNSEVDERPQDHQEATCAPKISKDEACIRWDAGGDAVHNLVRALHPSPGAYALLAEKRVKIWKTQPVRHALPAGSLQPDSDGYPLVGCGTDAVRLLSVQPQGKKPQDARDWFNGLQGKKGLWFSCSHRNDARH